VIVAEQLTGSGAQYPLAAGRYRATVTELGAGLRELTFDGRDLVVPYAADQAAPLYRGVLLAPWPNRIAQGRYRFGGVEHQLPITEPERDGALHGLVAGVPWSVADRGVDGVGLQYRLAPTAGYPFALSLRVDYRLDAERGLGIELGAANAGNERAPYGASIHPYLVGGPGRVDDWTFSLPADEFEDVEPQSLIPIGTRPVDGTVLDWRTPRLIGTDRADHALTGVRFDAGGCASAELRAADGSGVRMEWDHTCRWVQVHTADRPEPWADRVGLAVEPMTCAPDAFNSGAGLLVLEPSERQTTSWRITAI